MFYAILPIVCLFVSVPGKGKCNPRDMEDSLFYAILPIVCLFVSVPGKGKCNPRNMEDSLFYAIVPIVCLFQCLARGSVIQGIWKIHCFMLLCLLFVCFSAWQGEV